VSASHDVGERCTSTPHAQHEGAQRGHAQRGHAQQVHATRAWEAQARKTQACRAIARTAGTRNASMGGASTHNASMHRASTKHGPAHPRDVDDVDGRRPHDVDERYTHHTSSTKAHIPSTHSTGTRSRQGPERAHIDDKPHEHAVHSSLAAVGPPPGRRVRCAAQPLMSAAVGPRKNSCLGENFHNHDDWKGVFVRFPEYTKPLLFAQVRPLRINNGGAILRTRYEFESNRTHINRFSRICSKNFAAGVPTPFQVTGTS